MRDLETIRTAMTAAETGHLILATLHTKGAVNTIIRIIDTFAADQQDQIRIQLSAVRSMIRDCKTHRIASAIAAGGSEGMISMDQSLYAAFREGRITRQTALDYADDPKQMQRRMA